jgi:hypothetical protein
VLNSLRGIGEGEQCDHGGLVGLWQRFSARLKANR